ncbi:MAG: PadR family transcriptional regulator [Candidatus Thermoplasmatota archaeon]|jgi:DNA-binding PadR family transcriptional regulator|nr:PadR family transcriptional regulator [Candidatus Thermoplasmatota archaeon]
MASTNRVAILFTLSRGKRSLYELSKILATDGRKKSSGTLLPIMRKLEEEGYVSKETAGRIRYYSLTERGKKHVGKLKSLSGEIRKGFLRAFMRQEILITETRKRELLLSPDFVKRLQMTYEMLGDELIELISVIFNMALREDYALIDETKVKLKNLIAEVRNGVQ